MNDLEMAKKKLERRDLTLCVVKGNMVIFESVMGGISGFLTAVEKLGRELEGASIADRIAGRAIALLCVNSKVKAVYASILSKKGKAVFEEYDVHHEWDQIVESVLDINRVGTCPFEKLAAEISDPSKAYRKIKDLQHLSSRR